jgi:hypothetical protein
MTGEKTLVVLDMTTPVARKTQRAGAMPCPMDIAKAESAWSEQARPQPPKVTLQDPPA